MEVERSAGGDGSDAHEEDVDKVEQIRRRQHRRASTRR